MYKRNRLLLILGIGLFLIFLISHLESKEYKVTVLSHSITSDRDGRPRYNTIIMYKDGSVQSKVGLDLYMIPVGETTVIKILEWK